MQYHSSYLQQAESMENGKFQLLQIGNLFTDPQKLEIHDYALKVTLCVK